METSLLHSPDGEIPLLLQIGYDDYEPSQENAGGEEYRNRSLECKKILLQNDADPTIGEPYSALLDNLQSQSSKFSLRLIS